jgi:Trk-type K+ transport system membrane component
MTAIGSLLVVLTLSFAVTRLATVALALTGLAAELARLQSVSAITGVGFTTTESEPVVNHPVRRRILILLMIVGNAGIVTAIASLILSFTGVHRAQEGLGGCSGSWPAWHSCGPWPRAGGSKPAWTA